MHTDLSIYGNTFLFFLGKYLSVRLLGHMVKICLHLIIFQSCCTICIPVSNIWKFPLFCILISTRYWYFVFCFGILIGVWWYIIVVFGFEETWISFNIDGACLPIYRCAYLKCLLFHRHMHRHQLREQGISNMCL